MSDEASPRPWFVQNYVHHPDNPVVCDANGECVADDVSNANAALIVDAVNERDKLRDIMRRMAETLEYVSKEHRFDFYELVREARAAIGENEK